MCVSVSVCVCWWVSQMEQTTSNRFWLTGWDISRVCLCAADSRWTMHPILRGAREYHFRGTPGELVRAWVCKKCCRATYMDNTVWEGNPPTRICSSSNNNACEAANSIDKACRYLSAPGIECLTATQIPILSSRGLPKHGYYRV